VGSSREGKGQTVVILEARVRPLEADSSSILPHRLDRGRALKKGFPFPRRGEGQTFFERTTTKSKRGTFRGVRMKEGGGRRSLAVQNRDKLLCPLLFPAEERAPPPPQSVPNERGRVGRGRAGRGASRGKTRKLFSSRSGRGWPPKKGPQVVLLSLFLVPFWQRRPFPNRKSGSGQARLLVGNKRRTMSRPASRSSTSHCLLTWRANFSLAFRGEQSSIPAVPSC